MRSLDETRIGAELRPEIIIVVAPFAKDVEAVDLVLPVDLREVCVIAEAFFSCLPSVLIGARKL